MENNSLSRADYVAALQHGVCRIEFTKKDGTERIMYATLNQHTINGLGVPFPQTNNPPKEDRLIVVDYEKAAWRTVLIDNITLFRTAWATISLDNIDEYRRLNPAVWGT